ncbi:hypothetical protein NUKP84_20020 [Klebsiella variicola]|nr:hypothetical protein NUKP84_20020 [Klebsiella variicola]
MSNALPWFRNTSVTVGEARNLWREAFTNIQQIRNERLAMPGVKAQLPLQLLFCFIK